MLLRRCPDRRNRTGEIVEALRTAPDGSVIRFEPGIYDFFADEAVIIGLKPPSTNGRRFSPISITGHFPI